MTSPLFEGLAPRPVRWAGTSLLVALLWLAPALPARAAGRPAAAADPPGAAVWPGASRLSVPLAEGSILGRFFAGLSTRNRAVQVGTIGMIVALFVMMRKVTEQGKRQK